MAEVLLFHHARGLTPGVLSFADELRAAGHPVHTPDLYDGRTFDDLDEGVAYAQSLGMQDVVERGRRSAESLPNALVYGGFSLGMLPAQMLAQTRPGARGALLFHDCIPPSEFGTAWPPDVPLQVHTMEEDPWVDLPSVREVVGTVEKAELYVYPGNGHLFADEGSPDYDAAAAALLKQRVLDFLDALA